MKYFRLTNRGFGIQRWILTEKEVDNNRQIDLYNKNIDGKIVKVGIGYY